MSDSSAMRKVTFSRSRPMGLKGTFEHDGQMWIAYPADKNQRIWATMDRMLAQYGRIHSDMVAWINDWPTDARRVQRALEIIGRGKRAYDEMTREKTEALLMGSQITPGPVGTPPEPSDDDPGEYLATKYDHRPMYEPEPDGLESQED